MTDSDSALLQSPLLTTDKSIRATFSVRTTRRILRKRNLCSQNGSNCQPAIMFVRNNGRVITEDTTLG
ncbi:hypothetical protein, partial [Bifidobacterium breve]|uniref:hypothetical protein n=1 Tax=Bifidobacterium breve TaxID=1685 RepID=UPI001D02C440